MQSESQRCEVQDVCPPPPPQEAGKGKCLSLHTWLHMQTTFFFSISNLNCQQCVSATEWPRAAHAEWYMQLVPDLSPYDVFALMYFLKVKCRRFGESVEFTHAYTCAYVL